MCVSLFTALGKMIKTKALVLGGYKQQQLGANGINSKQPWLLRGTERL